MKRDDYRPVYGLLDSSESIVVCILSFTAYWSRYVNHYLKGGVYKARGIFAPHISRQQLEKMLPDYETEPQRDGRM